MPRAKVKTKPKVKFNWGKYFNIQGVVALITTLTLLVGSVIGVQAYFAKEREFKAYVEATDKKFVEADKRIAEGDTNLLVHQAEQSKSYVQEKLWKVQDRIEQKPTDTAAKQQLRELQKENYELETRIQDLKGGKK
jgi:cell division protein FtsB